jgi:RNA polymerase sigma-70 factor (ECF subfamily)
MIDQNLHKEFLKRIKGNEGIIYKICNSYCSNKADREDLGQEIIYQLLKSYSTFNDTNKFSTWMYRVALNVAISFYRKRKTGDVITLVEKQEDKEDDNKHAVHLENNITRMHQFISELKELDKALMILYLESKNYKEIAEILGITETNVATKISRIKEILRQKFSTFN